MKIVSINRQYTTDAQHLALNMREPISQDVIKRLQECYPSIGIEASDTVLLLDTSRKQNSYCIIQETIEEIEQEARKIAKDISQEQQRAQSARNHMLQLWAHVTGLELEPDETGRS